MAKTAHLDLPLVAPAQAQKHVTVNEALTRLDAVVQLRVKSASLTSPPSDAVDGTSYLIPEGASGDWSSKAGQVAVRNNGGWIYIRPKVGWRAWDEERSCGCLFDGSGWVPGAVAVSPGGAATAFSVLEFDHILTVGPTNTSSVVIPSHAQVIGVTGRVVSSMSGAGLTGWRIGVNGSDNRYGSGLGLAAGSHLVGLTGSPVTYYADTALLLTGEGGSFAAGAVRIAVHLVGLRPPRTE